MYKVFKHLNVEVHRGNLYFFLFQVCSIQIESFAYDKENLRFGWHSPGVEFANIIEIPHFKLEGKTNLRHSNYMNIDLSQIPV